MYDWESRVLVQHYLEQGLAKTAIAERVGISRRTLYYWLAREQLTPTAEAPHRFPRSLPAGDANAPAPGCHTSLPRRGLPCLRTV